MHEHIFFYIFSNNEQCDKIDISKWHMIQKHEPDSILYIIRFSYGKGSVHHSFIAIIFWILSDLLKPLSKNLLSLHDGKTSNNQI